ncbi:phthiocerol/phthiodiolone dimycocerosyl transferase [Tsukamurella sp. TY48]|nr:phthiocerol/phthiodiolone dimycocerosyl transferase [Tsukamurella sp. TY48]
MNYMRSATNVSPGFIRPLATTESFFTLGGGMYVGYGVVADGPVDLEALRAAAARLSAAYPGLRARITVEDPMTGAFVANDGAAPIAVSSSIGEPTGLAPLKELSIAQNRAIAEIHVVTGSGTEQAVYLLVHHALADGHHALALLQALWTSYTAIVTGGDGVLDERSQFPIALEDFLAERGFPTELPIEAAATSTVDPADAPSATAATGTDAAPDSGMPALHRAQLSATETAALIAYGHRAGRTVNQLVSAAFIAASATVRGLGASRILYGYPVDLRRRLGEPAAGFTDITNALGMAFFQADSDEASLDELAAQVGAGLARDLDAGTVQRPMSMAFGAEIPEDCAVAVITNWGPVPHLPTPDGLSLTEFLPAFHLDVPAAPGGADWSALAAKMTFAIVSSFDGRLNVDLSGGAESAELATELLRNLRAFALTD